MQVFYYNDFEVRGFNILYKLFIMTNFHKQWWFGTLPNIVINDHNLSFRAKWLYLYLWSKPPNWTFSIERISKQTKDWVDAIKSSIRELQNKWYLKITKKRLKNWKWWWANYHIDLYNLKVWEDLKNKPQVEKPQAVKHPHISNKDNSNTNIYNNNIRISRNTKDSFEVLQNQYWLSKEYIEKNFEHKKSLKTIIWLCEYIKDICNTIWLEPEYTKDSINIFDRAIKEYWESLLRKHIIQESSDPQFDYEFCDLLRYDWRYSLDNPERFEFTIC